MHDSGKRLDGEGDLRMTTSDGSGGDSTHASPGLEPRMELEQHLHMFRQMAKIRAFEEQVHELYKGAKMPGLAHLYVGQEGVARRRPDERIRRPRAAVLMKYTTRAACPPCQAPLPQGMPSLPSRRRRAVPPAGALI